MAAPVPLPRIPDLKRNDAAISPLVTTSPSFLPILTHSAFFDISQTSDQAYIMTGFLPGSPSGMFDLRSPSKNRFCKAGSHL
jgi:hypothetical protein